VGTKLELWPQLKQFHCVLLLMNLKFQSLCKMSWGLHWQIFCPNPVSFSCPSLSTSQIAGFFFRSGTVDLTVSHFMDATYVHLSLFLKWAFLHFEHPLCHPHSHHIIMMLGLPCCFVFMTAFHVHLVVFVC
jgi:hypothetical protein